MAFIFTPALEKEYDTYWSQMKVVKTNEATAQANQIIAHKDRYKAVEKTTGVPWFVIGCLHMRESNGNFNTWLHNGDPMRDHNWKPVQTFHEPPHRPPNPDVTWEEGAFDALVTCEHLDQIKTWGPAPVAFAAEKFNGPGYRNPKINIPSPYLWGGTTIQKLGKFIRDGVFDHSVMDPQIGVMAVLYMLMMLDPEAKFPEVVTTPPPVAATTTEAKPMTIDLSSITSLFNGNKTYIALAVGAVVVIANHFGISIPGSPNLDPANWTNDLFTLVLGGTFRSALGKLSPV